MRKIEWLAKAKGLNVIPTRFALPNQNILVLREGEVLTYTLRGSDFVRVVKPEIHDIEQLTLFNYKDYLDLIDEVRFSKSGQAKALRVYKRLCDSLWNLPYPEETREQILSRLNYAFSYSF